MSAADYSVRGPVAVVTFNNPPMNTLAHPLRAAVQQHLRAAIADEQIKAIVLIGGGRAFCAGAEVREFNTPAVLLAPNTRDLIAAYEASPKPVIAAVHGVAMGGGLEQALGCHFRVASAGAQIALPEVKLGILPGAGGTQRLPRAIGVEKALNMIVSGEAVMSETLAGSLFDEIIAGDLLEGAVAFAEKVVAEKRPLKRLRDVIVDYPHHEAFFQFARNTIAAAAKNYPAPAKCLEAVAAAVTMKIDDGLLFERECFMFLVNTTESRALRHAFFAERAAAKVPDVPESTPVRPIRSAAVVGAGTMGGGIAMNFANAGIPVTLLETTQEALDRGLATVRGNYEKSRKRGRLTAEQFAQRTGLVNGTLSYDALKNADIVIEAVYEDIKVKEQVFRKLDEVMKPGAILATNTSTLDVNTIAGFTRRPQEVIGTHFFSPANVMKLLEVVRGAKTAKDVLATTLALSKKIRKTGVVSGVCDGFIGNRMIEQYLRQAGFMLEEGCTPAQVDRAAEQFGFAMGPFRMSDLAGNDIGWHIRKRRYTERPEMIYSRIPDLICELGRFGQKTGAGFYDYKPGDRKALPSALVDELVIRHSKEIGVERRRIGDDEIAGRLVYALVNEGARILEEGIALRASDIDMVYLAGYGFPPWRGGPMFYADTVGLAQVVAAMARYASARHGEFWQSAPLLVKLAAEGKTFN